MKKILFAMACLVFLPVSVPAPDENEDKNKVVVEMELNQVKQRQNACVAFFVLKNQTAHKFTSIKTELITFDKKGLLSNRILGNFGKMRAGKTMVKLLSFPDTKCADIDYILINDINECAVDGKEEVDCLELITPSNRSEIKLIK